MFIFLSSCAEDDLELSNDELIFPNSYQIKIPAYQYSDEFDEVYFVRGDSGYNSDYPDTLNATPVLAWDSIGLSLMTVAIFNSPIIVRDDEIVNQENIVWKWHSGMNFGFEGYVQYVEGKNVINGEESEDVTPLAESHYYWGVWAWSSNGKRILYSSRTLEFYVTN
jgi:hypothetical protein